MKKGDLLNSLLVFGFSAFVAAWTLYAYASGYSQGGPEWLVEGNISFSGESATVHIVADSESSITRNGRDSLVFLPGFEADLTWNEGTDHFDVNLQGGEMILATLAGDFDVSVDTGFSRVDSTGNISFVSYDQEAMQIEVYSEMHPNLLTFTLDGEDLNSINVPSGYKMKVSESRVTEKLQKLRLTKLSKEFPVFEFKNSDIEETYLSSLNELEQRYTDSELTFINDLASNSEFGPAQEGLGAKINDVLNAFRETITFVPHAKKKLQEQKSANALLFSMSHAKYGNFTESQNWMGVWTEFEHSESELKRMRADLFFVLPGDDLYAIKSQAATRLYGEDDVLSDLNRRYNEIESLLSRASYIDAEQAYMEYKSVFEQALQSGKFDDVEYLDDITREYLLLELLLRKNSVFYKTESTELLSKLEDVILSLAGTQQDLDEERLAFVQSRVRFLENLFNFVVDRKVSKKEATELATELLFEAEDYLNSITTKVAVSDYFEGKLTEFELSISFINSPEFMLYDDFDEGLKEFKLKAEDLDALNAYIQSIREGDLEEEATISLEDAIKEVKTDLSTAGVQYSGIISLGDLENRLFKVQGARSAGYAFEANYDRTTKLLYDVVVGDVRFSTGIRLDSIRDVIKEAVEGSEEEFIEEEESSSYVSTSSSSESVALEFAAQKFSEAGLDPDDFTFVVLDLDANTFTFDGIISSVPVSGTFNAISGVVSEIVWEYGGVSKTLPNMQISALEGAIQSSLAALNEQQ
ncbi:hypothetical protein KKC94_01390 [Patescibacteria group bacterium]|nr:hypothetical protein [Patescibacteria group bacterium]